MQPFENLQVWERSHHLVLEVYRLSRDLPDDERFGLVTQIRRAVVSVPTNIAEGSKRRRGKDFARFLNVAEASLAETRYLLILARDLSYAPAESVEALLGEAEEIARMLHTLRVKVEREATR